MFFILGAFASCYAAPVNELCHVRACIYNPFFPPRTSSFLICFVLFSTHGFPLSQSTPLLHEAASDAVCALLQVVADQENEDVATQNGQLTSTLNELRTLEDSLVQSIKNLEPAYHLAVAEEDTEKFVITRSCRHNLPI